MPDLDDIDIKENYIKQLDDELLSILLKDRSSGKNIIWATDIYAEKGPQYDSWEPITVRLITGRLGKVIRPRIDKSQKEQKIRIKDKAEVFTPSWICNEMNNHLSDEWFEEKNLFNTEDGKTWKTNKNRIPFVNKENKTWQDYVKLKVLEISCGEAPFLVSRYDTTTGQWIDVNERIGALDRKLRVINENVDSEPDWYNWVLEAYKSTYGYEWQGDSILIARENMLFTFIDYYLDKFNNFPIKEYLIEIAKILSWNIWQMDGLKYVIPNSCKPAENRQMSFFNNEKEPCIGCLKNDNSKHTGVYCKIMNWETKRSIKFFKGEKRMKFDFVIGNPPYQVSDGGAQASAKPVYHTFIESSIEMSPKCISMIVPSRWMTGGKGLDKFRYKFIHDRRLKSLYDYFESNKCFSNVDIKGGVCYFLWDRDYNGKTEIHSFTPKGEIISKRFLAEENDNLFIRYSELVSIKNKVLILGGECFEKIVSPRRPYGLSGDVFKDEGKYQLPKMSNIPINNGFTVFGLDEHLKRVKKYVPVEYPFPKREYLTGFKLFMSRNQGTGLLGEEFSTPIFAGPKDSCTETFVVIGPFDTEEQSLNSWKYIKTKFCRALIGVRKQDQGASKTIYQFVPLQNFTENSDIDWSKSIHEIDLQLYKKYGLDDTEISFIESHIKEMK